ncbi:DUF1205 domain-containing protein [Dactylosporangium fulvum]|uniref:DUF1205 domain-containing protein n=1 Tax=Dactylosporangium fulvum TaxID=53359 RepID=A0ABY5W9F7_9ACTN|nr:nucleotide disphospho-sugar-binding domain-containing protein [Dactylosporangium fulvum]UWP86124.1 DUF1205 domain-containing protein [Dactylosporangium fulvum]
MRVIVTPLHLTTHLTEMVPLCWALRAAGHEVLVVGAPDLAGVSRAAGLNIATVGEPVNMIESGAPYMPRELFPAEALGRRDTEAGRELWRQCAAAFAPEAGQLVDAYLALSASWRPDLVITDSMSLLGWAFGAAAGVPAVLYHCGVAPLLGPFEEQAQLLLEPLRKRLGLPRLPAAAAVLDPCPPSLQAEDAPPGHRVRYVPYNQAGVLPDWALHRDGAPLVCVSFGSILAWSGPRPLRAALDAVAALDGVEVVVTLSAANRELLGAVPEHFRLVEALPLNLFLERCDLIVHHGGTGTGLTAAALGVPQVVLPQWGNGFDFGRRLTEAGAGRSVTDRAGQDDTDALAGVLRTVLHDPAFRGSALRLRAEIEALPSPAATVTLLEELARGTARC